MLEKVILFAILGVAIVYIAYSLFFKKNKDCGCGCEKGCNSSKK